jgi:hypothetical protein
MEISWTDRVKSDKVLQRFKEERNVLCTIERRTAIWFGHILRRNCLLKHVIEGVIEVTERTGRRRKQLLGDLKKKRG